MKSNKLITFFLLSIVVVCFPATSSLAGEDAVKKHPEVAVSMEMKDKPLRRVLQDISEKTGYRIEVSDDLLDIPISGSFKDTTLTVLLGRMLKGRNVFILEDSQLKLITVRTSLSKKEKVTTVFTENNVTGKEVSAENYSLGDLQAVQDSLDEIFNEQGSWIEASPGVTYQEMMETQRQIDQQLSTVNGKYEVEVSPGVTYQEMLDGQVELNNTINSKNSGIKAASGVQYHKVIRSQEELDTFIVSGESPMEASPGVTYQELLANQAKLDQQLKARKY